MKTSKNTITSTTVTETNLDPWPIDKTNILTGDAEAHGTVLWQSKDKLLCNGVWSCTTGKFNWKYTWNETFYLVQGKISISIDDAESKEYNSGDLVFVPTGTNTTWTIIEPVRKVFHLESETPLEF